MKHFTFLFLILLLPLFVNAQITLYGRFVTEPVNYVTDQAGVLAQYEEDQLNDKLRNFEDSTSNQLFIYIAESLRANDLEDFSREIFNKWGIGQKDKNNGILIAIFIDDRKYRIQIGYGLEAALPSELCRQIQDEFMGPHFKQKNYYEGINAGVDKLIYYSRHEYKPPTAFEKMQTPILVTFLIGLVIFAINLASLKKWNNQPKRKQKYLLLGVSFLGGAAILTVIAVFVTESPYALVPLLLGVFAEILLCTVINDKDDIKYDNESDNEYDRRMLRQRSSSSNDSSSDSFSGGGGGRSGSGGSSSSW
jgi:uncharacterized protein